MKRSAQKALGYNELSDHMETNSSNRWRSSVTRRSSAIIWKLALSLPWQSAHRRQLETLLASADIHGGSVDNGKPALDGMIVTVLKYSKVDDPTEYISKQVKFKNSFKRI